MGVEEQTGNAKRLRQCLEFAGRNFADHLAGIGVDFLNHLMARRGIEPVVVWATGALEMLVQLRDQRMQIEWRLGGVVRWPCRLGRTAGRQELAAGRVGRCRRRRLDAPNKGGSGCFDRNCVVSHDDTYQFFNCCGNAPSRHCVRVIATKARALARPGRGLLQITLRLSIGCYCKSLRINWGCWLACANTEMPACCNTLDWVNLAVSAAKSAS